MDLSSLTLPNLSQYGQKNTDKELVKPEVKNYLTSESEVYQRAGLVLPTEIELFPNNDVVDDAIVASNDDKARLALPQTIIDIETALAEDYLVVLSIELYDEIPKQFHQLSIPDRDLELLGIIQIVLVGYDRQTRLFSVRTQNDRAFVISYDYVVDELVAFDLWAIAH